MLEIVLTVTVVAAVVLVGLLISIGNERQRKALEGVRESLKEWAISDLKIKRARAEQEIFIEEPILWLDSKAASVLGSEPGIRDTVQVIQYPRAIEVETSEGSLLVFSPLEPEVFRRICGNSRDHSGLLNEGSNILGKRPHKSEAYELSALNAGIFFDVELNQVWKRLTGAGLEADRLWMYSVGE